MINEIQEKSCGCIIIENNKVLLLRHKTGHWGFPKGHVEAGETELETAKREVKEEIITYNTSKELWKNVLKDMKNPL